MYVDFIEEELLPEINSLAEKYADWWTFKPSSPLKAYLSDREIVMDEYFSLEELRYRVMSILEHAAQFLNSDVIVLADQELQMVFDSWYIFVPDIIENHLLSHVIPAPVDIISNDLQNKHMIEDFFVYSPVDIIYKDPSSVFWIHPFVDFAMNRSTGNVGSWNKLLFMFTEFCLNNTTYFTRFSDSIIGINVNTSLTSLFDFKFFHLSQVETLLQQITKFLGRKNSMIQSCHFITHNPTFDYITSIHPNVFTFIDYIINNHNDMMPDFKTGIFNI